MKKLFLFLSFVFPLSAMACLNDYDSDSYRRQQIFYYARNFDFEDLDKRIKETEVYGMSGYQDSTRHAVRLAKRGYVFRSLYLLRKLAKDHPEDYVIVANLETLYELAGKPDSALTWIKKGIQLNPESHQGSEWVHVKILEAKLALAKDPDWLKKNTILGLKGEAPRQSKDRPAPQYAPEELHVMYQLRERMLFTAGADPVFAAVLWELAKYQRNVRVQEALLHYEYAIEYATTEKEQIAKEHKALHESYTKRHGRKFRESYYFKQELDKERAYAVLDNEAEERLPADPGNSGKLRDLGKDPDVQKAMQKKQSGKEHPAGGAPWLRVMLALMVITVYSLWMMTRER